MGRAAFKSDKFKKHRGGHSRWLSVFCEKCKTPLLVYQKDGSGILKRLYLDRIVAPEALVGLQKKAVKMIPNLVCKKCAALIGVPMIYEKEQRTAYRLFVGAVGKKVVPADRVAKMVPH